MFFFGREKTLRLNHTKQQFLGSNGLFKLNSKIVERIMTRSVFLLPKILPKPLNNAFDPVKSSDSGKQAG